MYRHSEDQLSVYHYLSPFRERLRQDNRWVKLAHRLDWAQLERAYAAQFAPGGKEAIPFRCAFGSLIIKRALGLSDRQTLMLIQESPYLQYFIGLDDFTEKPPFSVRSMTAFRRRIPEKQVARAARMLNQR